MLSSSTGGEIFEKQKELAYEKITDKKIKKINQEKGLSVQRFSEAISSYTVKV